MYEHHPTTAKIDISCKGAVVKSCDNLSFSGECFFSESGFDRYKQEIGLNLDQGRLNYIMFRNKFTRIKIFNIRINNNIPGVRERHVYRRSYDDQINFTFYCDADQYLPIRFFEAWMNYITNTTNKMIQNLMLQE